MSLKDLTPDDENVSIATSNKQDCLESEKKTKKIHRRHSSREAAFILIFEKSFKQCSINELMDIDSERKSPDKYMLGVLKLLDERLEHIDDLISLYSKKWELPRLSKIALAVLRLAFAELESAKEPQAVIINEAVELAKLYGSEDDASYINGVLGGYVRDESRKLDKC